MSLPLDELKNNYNVDVPKAKVAVKLHKKTANAKSHDAACANANTVHYFLEAASPQQNQEILHLKVTWKPHINH